MKHHISKIATVLIAVTALSFSESAEASDEKTDTPPIFENGILQIEVTDGSGRPQSYSVRLLPGGAVGDGQPGLLTPNASPGIAIHILDKPNWKYGPSGLTISSKIQATASTIYGNVTTTIQQRIELKPAGRFRWRGKISTQVDSSVGKQHFEERPVTALITINTKENLPFGVFVDGSLPRNTNGQTVVDEEGTMAIRLNPGMDAPVDAVLHHEMAHAAMIESGLSSKMSHQYNEIVALRFARQWAMEKFRETGDRRYLEYANAQLQRQRVEQLSSILQSNPEVSISEAERVVAEILRKWHK